MAFNQGRYQFSGMARRIRDRLNLMRLTVDSGTGEETSSVIYNQLISNTDILNKLNTTMWALYTDAIMRKPDLFESDRQMDIEAQVVQYNFPLQMLQFTALMWKQQSVQNPRPTDFIEMICVDDPHDYEEQSGRYIAPTYRRLGDGFILNSVPQTNNPGGIMVRGVFLPPPIMDDLATNPVPPPQQTYVQAPFAQLAQEVMILDSTKQLAQEKLLAQPASLDEELGMWRIRFDIAVDNAQHPRSVQITSSRLIQQTYSGRRNGRNWSRGW